MNLPALTIGEKTAPIPIIQGGMGIGVSRSGLAAAVAEQGGVGVISAVQIGYLEPDFETDHNTANARALEKEIAKARKACPHGVLGINVLVAMKSYREVVAAAVKEKIDLIIAGAGLPTDLPAMVQGTATRIAPIVSSGKAAMLMAKMWDRKYSYAPDLVVVEGPQAGGHLGFSVEELQASQLPSLSNIVKDVIAAVAPFADKYGKPIPVVVAGGIYTGADIAEYLKIGAAGVQMATRFVATEECDAHLNFKMAYVNCREEDIQLVQSPVGMPGRAIRNELLRRLEDGRIPFKKCYLCLKTCQPKTTPYCISRALINAVEGNVDEGLIFAGSNAWRIDRITTVKELMQELVAEAEAALA
ncbi:MAG: nitronate monooxygenase [Syntrophomonadaceae bacterium]|nr:nitronate monooxygenase [Syntrophomonadaceae bacterium]